MRKFAVNKMFDAPKATRSHKMHMKAIKKFIKTLFPFLMGFHIVCVQMLKVPKVKMLILNNLKLAVNQYVY